MNKKYVCPSCDRELDAGEISRDINTYHVPGKSKGLRTCVYCGYTGPVSRFWEGEMKLWNNLKELFNVRAADDKPVTITMILGQDSCSRLLSDFNDYHLDGCEKLLIIKLDSEGSIDCFTSQNMSTVEAIGVTSAAHNLFLEGGDDD